MHSKNKVKLQPTLPHDSQNIEHIGDNHNKQNHINFGKPELLNSNQTIPKTRSMIASKSEDEI